MSWSLMLKIQFHRLDPCFSSRASRLSVVYNRHWFPLHVQCLAACSSDLQCLRLAPRAMALGYTGDHHGLYHAGILLLSVGNFRVEPPGLFRGRGEHPKMGMLKKRIYPRDITINIGKDAAIPEHPYKGQQWKEVRHDNTVTWLAFWKDPISEKDYKYVWLAANSTFKSDSDLAKYEKARRLKNYIGKIREDYSARLEQQECEDQANGSGAVLH
eukprot:jgi/Botrbrau1/29/Bobra.0022s0024.1